MSDKINKYTVHEQVPTIEIKRAGVKGNRG